MSKTEEEEFSILKFHWLLYVTRGVSVLLISRALISSPGITGKATSELKYEGRVPSSNAVCQLSIPDGERFSMAGL